MNRLQEDDGRRQDDCGGWTEVRRRGRRARRDLIPKDSTTFFIRNFPENCSVERLATAFKDIGRVVDIYIPTKRYKLGKRFGFVRFEGLDKCKEKLEKMNKTWIGSFIIRASLPRFARLENAAGFLPAAIRKPQYSPAQVMHAAPPKTFAAALSSATTSPKEIPRTRDSGTTGNFQSSTEERKWLADGYTGKLREEFLWKFHGFDIKNECYGKLSLADMGDRMLLIRNQTDLDTKTELSKHDTWRDSWFEWCRPWKSSDVKQRWFVWTKWTGVPLQAWTRRFFSWSCEKVGRVVEIHPETGSRRSLDVAHVRILTGLSTLERVFSCKIDGRSFNIRIEELRSTERDLPRLPFAPRSDCDSVWGESSDAGEFPPLPELGAEQLLLEEALEAPPHAHARQMESRPSSESAQAAGSSTVRLGRMSQLPRPSCDLNLNLGLLVDGSSPHGSSPFLNGNAFGSYKCDAGIPKSNSTKNGPALTHAHQPTPISRNSQLCSSMGPQC